MRDILLEVIYEVIDEINPTLSQEMKLAKAPDTILYGSQGALDSLGLVNFVVAAEQRLSSRLGKPVTLSDERALSVRNSPFRSIESLVEYVSSMMAETSDE